MNIVIDSNILFSALIKDSITREIIFKSNDTFLCPSMILIELDHHKSMLIKKSQLSEKDFHELFILLMSKIIIVPIDDLFSHMIYAESVVKDIDPDDVLFIATAMAFPDCILWSNDAALKRQNIVRVINTDEMLKLLK